MSSRDNSEMLVAPTASNMIPMPYAGLAEMDAASHDGADSGIGLKIEQKPVNAPEAENKPLDDHQKPTTKTRDISTRGSSFALPPERLVTSSIMGRYSTDILQQRLLRLSTVSARNSLRHQRTFYHPLGEAQELPRRITWYEATESRPPLRIDMSGPSPTTYSPCNKPLYETNAPAYSFGRKDIEKTGSGQKAWGKTWFRSQSPFTFKTNYELHWPSPFHYQQKSTLGPRQVNKQTFPSHSIGQPQTLPIRKKPVLTSEPMPTIYYPDVIALSRMRRAPAHSMGIKLSNRNWTPILNVPAPNVYNPLGSVLITKPSPPSYTVCGSRREKRHDLGPFFAL